MKEFQNVVTQNLLEDTVFHVHKDTQLGLFQKPKKYNPQPPFLRIGNGMKGQHGTAYPLLETMLEFSKPEAWLFAILLKTHSDKSGQSDISKLTFTKVDLNNLSKAYTLLKQRDLVKRVKRQVYMINPSAIITDKWEEHKEVWKGLV